MFCPICGNRFEFNIDKNLETTEKAVLCGKCNTVNFIEYDSVMAILRIKNDVYIEELNR